MENRPSGWRDPQLQLALSILCVLASELLLKFPAIFDSVAVVSISIVPSAIIIVIAMSATTSATPRSLVTRSPTEIQVPWTDVESNHLIRNRRRR